MLVSFIVTSYNYSKYVLETIQEYEIAKPMDGAKIEEEFSSFSIKENIFVIKISGSKKSQKCNTFLRFFL